MRNQTAAHQLRLPGGQRSEGKRNPSDSLRRTNLAIQGQKPAPTQCCLSPQRRGTASRCVCGHDVGKVTVGHAQAACEGQRPETVTRKKPASGPGAPAWPQPQEGPCTHASCARAAAETVAAVSACRGKARDPFVQTPRQLRPGGRDLPETLCTLVLSDLGFASAPTGFQTPVVCTRLLCSSQAFYCHDGRTPVAITWLLSSPIGSLPVAALGTSRNHLLNPRQERTGDAPLFCG